MSFLLNALIVKRRNKAIEYNEYLRQMALLANRVDRKDRSDVPPNIKTDAQNVLYNNLGKNEQLALEIDEMVQNNKNDNFRGDEVKERLLMGYIYKLLKSKGLLHSDEEVMRIYKIIENQAEY
jgi:type I restriction enzyme R subunit